MTLKTDIKTIAKHTGIFATAGLVTGIGGLINEDYALVPLNILQQSMSYWAAVRITLFGATIIGASSGLAFGCASVLVNNLIDLGLDHGYINAAHDHITNYCDNKVEQCKNT